MRDYYSDLGVSRAANAAEIRAAYKKLAKQLHPDRNPGNKQAEEAFKAVNEAYHVLCNPLKKAQYDLQLYGLTLTYNRQHWEQVQQERNYQERYYRWERARANRYRFDKNYFKIQGLAFLVFLIIAGFCFSVIHTAHYYVRKQERERYVQHTQMIRQATGLFNKGQFADAFTLLDNLEIEDPLEYRFGFAKDSLMAELRRKADLELRNQKFDVAIEHYKVLQNYETPHKYETLQNISLCQYYLGNYGESVTALKHLHNQDPYNLALIYEIGRINLEKLNNPDEALQYFTMGKKLFKQNLGQVYGAAFRIVMNPMDAPDIYYHIFMGRAKANFEVGNYHDAITDCNWAIFLRRNMAEAYLLRANVGIKGRDFSKVCEDLSSASNLGLNTYRLRNRYCKQQLHTAEGE